jgi:hypothetical protein
LDKHHPVGKAVRDRKLPRKVYDLFGIDSVNFPRSRLTREQGKQAGSTPNLEHSIAGPHRRGDGFAVGLKALAIRDHLPEVAK